MLNRETFTDPWAGVPAFCWGRPLFKRLRDDLHRLGHFSSVARNVHVHRRHDRKPDNLHSRDGLRPIHLTLLPKTRPGKL